MIKQTNSKPTTRKSRNIRKSTEPTRLSPVECEFLEEVRNLRASLAVYRRLVDRLLSEALA